MNQLIALSEGKHSLSVVYLSPFDKGKAFEQYVSGLFNKKCGRFELLNGSNANASLYGKAAGTLFPDLKFLFYTKTTKYKFAVECKWRALFVNGKIKWAEEHQIRNYLQYGRQNNIPVFIAIGIGGSPDNPEKLFVTPLMHIADRSEVYEKDLIPFNRNPKQRFFYDARQLKLL